MTFEVMVNILNHEGNYIISLCVCDVLHMSYVYGDVLPQWCVISHDFSFNFCDFSECNLNINLYCLPAEVMSKPLKSPLCTDAITSIIAIRYKKGNF